MSRVVVCGSLNVDLVIDVDALPAAGETVSGSRLRKLPGGKGANQAYAAALAAGGSFPVAMVGRVGGDDSGRELIAALTASGVDVSGVQTVPGEASGTALITVDTDGGNTIVVAPGANGAWESTSVAEAHIAAGDVVVLQLEIPLAAVDALARHAADRGARVVLNAAPADARARSLLDVVDVLVVNEPEATHLFGIEDFLPENIETARSAMPCDLIVTRGEHGVVVAERSGTTRHIPAAVVDVVDTVGAGDAFVGTVAASLAAGAALFDAAVLANAAAALTCTVAGARHPALHPVYALEGVGDR